MQAHGFRVCFTPLLEVLFTFPSRYLSTIGLSVVFSLTGWAPPVPAELLVLRGTQVPSCAVPRVSRTGLSPSAAPVSTGLPLRLAPARADGPTTPGAATGTAPVWANARSLATTCAIIVIFSSSGYLDVSVPRVRPPRQTWCGGIAPAGFPHSDIRGSQGICPSPRLFAACHVLRRLREPQASPMRPFFLSLFLQARDMRQCRRPVPHELPPDRFRSIALSTRFLASILYSSRSQHVNDLFSPWRITDSNR